MAKLAGETWAQVDEVKRKDFKAPPYHMQTIIDGINLFGWMGVNSGDELKDFMKEMYDAVFFYGNKVLNLNKEPDSKWFNAYKSLCEAQFNFITKRKDSITKWTGSGDGAGAQASFLSGVVTVAEVKQAETVESKKEEVKVAAPVKKATPV